MSGAILEVQGLTLVSKGGSIVHDLSFQISPGEIVALTGKSGSGKTSIALALLNLLPDGINIESGTITWIAKDGMKTSLPSDTQTWSSLRGTHIGYTQQDVFGAFDPVLQIGSQMMMVIRERTQKNGIDLERELRTKMEEVGLHDLDRLWMSYPHQLSGGQLQRCQISMAVVIGPELIITDEPTSAIDKINQLELLDVFKMLKLKYKTAILCITHEEAVVRHLADREIQLDSLTYEFPVRQAHGSENRQEDKIRILEVSGLEYTHAYGGMVYKKGATIGELDFTLYRGKCLGIVGESGSGKSTLAQLLVGLFVPSKGEIVLKGSRIDFRKSTDIQRMRSSVQLVMQDGRGSLHPFMTVRRLLHDVIQIRKKTDINFSIDLIQVLQEVGLPESVLDRKAPQLSGGECLRVNIARALLMEPEVLVCDESTSALDGQTRDGIIDMLQMLMAKRGLALIFISHDERIIRGISNDIIVMAHGKVVEKGPAAELLTYPTHPVTKRIFASHATLRNS